MTIDAFWQRIEGAIRCDDLSMCPVKEYAKENYHEITKEEFLDGRE